MLAPEHPAPPGPRLWPLCGLLPSCPRPGLVLPTGLPFGPWGGLLAPLIGSWHQLGDPLGEARYDAPVLPVGLPLGGQLLFEILDTLFIARKQRVGVLRALPAWLPGIPPGGLPVGQEHPHSTRRVTLGLQGAAGDAFSRGALGDPEQLASPRDADPLDAFPAALILHEARIHDRGYRPS